MITKLNAVTKLKAMTAVMVPLPILLLIILLLLFLLFLLSVLVRRALALPLPLPLPSPVHPPRLPVLPSEPGTSQLVVQQQQPQSLPIRVGIDPNAATIAPGMYPQLGYLKPAAGSVATGILPVYGRPSIARNNRAFYYTIVPGSSIKVPLRSTESGQRDCMEDVGCEELSTGDLVTVPDAADAVGVPQDTQWLVVIYKYNRL